MARLSIPLKVAVGYIAVAGLLVGAMVYIVALSAGIVRGSDAVASMERRSAAIDRLMLDLLTSEGYASMVQSGMDGAVADLRRHNDMVRLRITEIDSLSDGAMGEALDSLSLLVDESEALAIAIGAATGGQKQLEKYYSEIENLVSQRDSLAARSQLVREIVRERTEVLVREPEKNLLKRIGRVFRPGDSDTLTVTIPEPKVTTDTVFSEVELTDSLGPIVAGITATSLKGSRIRESQRAYRLKELRRLRSRLVGHVGALVGQIESSEREYAAVLGRQEDDVRKRNAILLAVVGLGAIACAGIFFVLISRDVRRADRYRRELEEANDRNVKLMDSREKLLLAITHDIKSPLASVIGYAGLLSETSLDRDQSEYLDFIKKGSNRLLSMVTSLLDYYRLGSGEAVLRPVDFIPAQVVVDVAELFRPMSDSKGLSLTVAADPLSVEVVSADLFRWRQIVDNLVSNAIKYTNNGGVECHVSVSDGELSLEVSDSGRGLSPLEQSSIFRRFNRIDDESEGTGLGLDIVSRATAFMGGRLELESEPGRGSCFRVVVPFGQPRGAADESCGDRSDSSEGKRESEPNPVMSMDVLVLDDDIMQRRLMNLMLRKAGVSGRIDLASNVAEALEMCRSRKYGLIFSDIQMPGADGLDFARMFVEESGDTPLIGVTAGLHVSDSRYRDAGFRTVIAKPVDVKTLSDVLVEFGHPTELDLSGLFAFCGDDEPARNEVLSLFLSETRRNRELLVAAGTPAEAAAIAHKMLPTFIMVKAEGIACLRALEGLKNIEVWDESHRSIQSEALALIDRVLKSL